jgi:gamma-tubulin complex component 4
MGIVGEEVSYSKVFQYLLCLKWIQLELEKSWAETVQQDHADSAQ